MLLSRCVSVMRCIQDEPKGVRQVSTECTMAYTKASTYLRYLITKELVKREMFGGKYYFHLTNKGRDAGMAMKVLEEMELIK